MTSLPTADEPERTALTVPAQIGTVTDGAWPEPSALTEPARADGTSARPEPSALTEPARADRTSARPDPSAKADGGDGGDGGGGGDGGDGGDGRGGGDGGESGGEEVGPFDVKRAVIVGVVAVLVLAGAGFGAYATAGDVPRGTRVLGLDLGAKSRTEAEHVLHDRVDRHAADPVRIRLDGADVVVAPAAVGLRVNVEATVGRAMRGPVLLRGHRDVAPVVRVDGAKLAAVLRARLDPGRVTVRMPGITFDGLTVHVAYPETGLDFDPQVAAAGVRAAWPLGLVAEVPLTERAPVTSRAQVDALVRDLAEPAVAAPVTVTVGARTMALSPKVIAEALVFRADDEGRLTAAIDGARLHAAAAKEFGRVEQAPRDARIVLGGGRPRIIASADGELVDLDRLAADLLPVLSRPAGAGAAGTKAGAAGERAVAGTLVRVKARTTAADLAGLGIRERVSSFTTYFPGGRESPRSRNIITIASRVDGAIVRPGQTFSLNAYTGARDYAAGYQDAPVIVGGHLEPGVGGGASQFTTTLFNAAYYAGLRDVEHKPHSFYFSRYPAVIESTIFYPVLDLKFTDTTPYGILIETATTSRAVTVAMWSTKVYDSVTTQYGPRRRPTSPPTVRRPAGPKCLTSSGLPGFTQDAWRVIRKDGREVARERFTWRYDPEPRFVCGV